MSESLAGAAVALAVTTCSMPLVTLALRRFHVVDVPNERSSHQTPTARGGGVAVAAGMVTGAVVAQPTGDVTWTVVGVSLAFATVGLIDDVVGIDALMRLAVQLTGSVAVAFALVDRSGASRAALVLLVAIWIAGFVNSFNFMDGVNGISALTAIAMGATWWALGGELDAPFVSAGGAALVGAALAFLPWNVPRAYVFLGDVGSYAVGAWLALLAVVAWDEGLQWWLAIWPASIYVADTASTAVRRVFRGDRWYESHRSHVYQRLVDLGWPHVASALFAATCTGLIGVMAYLVTAGHLPEAPAALAVVAIVLVYLCSPWALREWDVRREAA